MKRDMHGLFDVLVYFLLFITTLIIIALIWIARGEKIDVSYWILLVFLLAYNMFVFIKYWLPMLRECPDRIIIDDTAVEVWRGRKQITKLQWNDIVEIGICLWDPPNLMKGAQYWCYLYFSKETLNTAERLRIGTCLRHRHNQNNIVYLSCRGMAFDDKFDLLPIDQGILNCIPVGWRKHFAIKEYPVSCAHMYSTGKGLIQMPMAMVQSVFKKVRTLSDVVLWLSYFSVVLNVLIIVIMFALK